MHFIGANRAVFGLNALTIGQIVRPEKVTAHFAFKFQWSHETLSNECGNIGDEAFFW